MGGLEGPNALPDLPRNGIIIEDLIFHSRLRREDGETRSGHPTAPEAPFSHAAKVALPPHGK